MINMQYTKVQINNNIRNVLEEGKSNEDALDLFLKMNMVNDRGPERPFNMKGPSLSEVHMNLIGNDDIDKISFVFIGIFPDDSAFRRFYDNCIIWVLL